VFVKGLKTLDMKPNITHIVIFDMYVCMYIYIYNMYAQYSVTVTVTVT
jgi:hypothetical protein